VQCPDCGAAVTEEVGYCFTCFKHVSPAAPELVEVEEPTKPARERFTGTIAPKRAKPRGQDAQDLIHEHLEELDEIFKTIKESSEAAGPSG
jgi:hypothetical protein